MEPTNSSDICHVRHVNIITPEAVLLKLPIASNTRKSSKGRVCITERDDPMLISWVGNYRAPNRIISMNCCLFFTPLVQLVTYLLVATKLFIDTINLYSVYQQYFRTAPTRTSSFFNFQDCIGEARIEFE